MVRADDGSAEVTRPGRCYTSLFILIVASQLAACAIQAPEPIDYSFSAPSLASLPRLGQQSNGVAGLALNAGAADRNNADVLTLPEAWRLALHNNQTYQAAVSARKASATLRAQGRAKLLPHIRAGLSYFRINGQRQLPLRAGGTITQPLSYNAHTFYIQLRQPLLDFGRFSSYQFHLARAHRGQVNWRAARNELAGKLIRKWVKLQAAYAKLKLQQELVASLARQAEAQQALYEHGAAPVTDVKQTRSKLKSARAQLIRYRTELLASRQALLAFIGVSGKQFETIAMEMAVSNLALRPLNDWLRRARKASARIKASRADKQVAAAALEHDIKKFWPSLHLTASWVRSNSEKLATVGQSRNTYAVGIQLTVPIYFGGRNNAQVGQSRAKKRQAAHQLQETIRNVQTRIARNYHDVRSAIERIRALKASINAAKTALEATRLGYQYGVKDNLDLLRARDELFKTRESLVQTRLNLLQSYIALRLTAGANPAATFRQAHSRFFEQPQHDRRAARQAGNRAGTPGRTHTLAYTGALGLARAVTNPATK